MAKYVVRRLGQSVLVLFGVTLLSFFSLHLAGDPTYLYVSDRATPEEIANVRHAFGFDQPVLVQYLNYLGRLARGDLGDSLSARVPALDLVLERLPATIELTFCAMLFSVVFSIPVGIFAALKRGTLIDRILTLIAILGQSVPAFWLGLMLLLFFGLNLGWLPISGYEPIIERLFTGQLSLMIQRFPDALRHLILPAVTIAVFSFSRNARLLRSSMLDVLSQDYVKTARSKGLREWAVILRHAFPNVLIPFVTIVGLDFGFLLGGVVVVETVFSWPGVGRLVYTAINQRDIPVVQVSVMLFALVFISLNLLTDLLYAQLDPRIRLA
jgi:peptide/nickel transport system permease protein